MLEQLDMEAAWSASRPFEITPMPVNEDKGQHIVRRGKMSGSFAFKGLALSERNFHVTDLEALVVVFALWSFTFMYTAFR